MINWVVNGWPHRTAVNGKYAFQQMRAGSQELESFDEPLTPAQRANLVGLIDAVTDTLR